jgi:RHS repeat-associated protein
MPSTWNPSSVGKTTSNNTIKFTGQYRDTDTTANLDYFGARYYSNTVGRFMSPDWAAKPVTVPYAKFGDPQSLNLYSYVENGPVNRADADGHSYAGMNGLDRDDSSGTPISSDASDASDPTPRPVAALDGDFKGKIEVTRIPESALEPVRNHCICDTYKVDKYNHGRPHIDRTNSDGKLVGRYNKDGSGIKHKGKMPPGIPHSDRAKFKKAAEELGKVEAAREAQNASESNSKLENTWQQYPVPNPLPPGLAPPLIIDPLCAGCEGTSPVISPPAPGGRPTLSPGRIPERVPEYFGPKIPEYIFAG